MKIVNLMPHPLVIQRGDGTRETFEPVGLARVGSTPGEIEVVEGVSFAAPTIYGELEGLPAPQEGVVYVVSMPVASRAKRADVVSPGTGPNDGCIREGGQVVAVTRLIRHV
jgi:hypothetical protein